MTPQMWNESSSQDRIRALMLADTRSGGSATRGQNEEAIAMLPYHKLDPRTQEAIDRVGPEVLQKLRQLN